MCKRGFRVWAYTGPKKIELGIAEPGIAEPNKKTEMRVVIIEEPILLGGTLFVSFFDMLPALFLGSQSTRNK